MTEISEYRLTCGDAVTTIEPTVAEGEQYEAAKHEVLPGYGEHTCTITAVDTDGLESEPSNAVNVIWDKRPPVAPTDFIILTE